LFAVRAAGAPGDGLAAAAPPGWFGAVGVEGGAGAVRAGQEPPAQVGAAGGGWLCPAADQVGQAVHGLGVPGADGGGDRGGGGGGEGGELRPQPPYLAGGVS